MSSQEDKPPKGINNDRMDQTLAQNLDKQKRAQFLDDNCEKKEEIGYMHRFKQEELTVKKDELATVAIEINDIKIEQKEAAKLVKEQLKPLEETKAGLLKDLKTKAEFRTEVCFKFIDHTERKVGYYNLEGKLVEERPARPEESQLTMKLLTGTNN